MEREIALSLREVCYAYRNEWTRRRHVALHPLTLEVYKGEAFGFLGHNGAGKTTTIKTILGLVRLSAGEIRIFGTPHYETGARAAIGYLPEHPYFYDHLTVNEIMELYATLASVERSRRRAAVDVALDRVKISARKKSPMRTLSKGLTQRVALAQAIVANPKLLILDEPFSGLDPIGRREFREIFYEIKQAGTTLFMSSHVLSDVEYLCDRASILSHGKLKGVIDLETLDQHQSGSYELVIREYERVEDLVKARAQACVRDEKFLRATFSEESNAREVLRSVLEAGVTVTSFQYIQPRLEDIFVQMVKFEEGGTSTR